MQYLSEGMEYVRRYNKERRMALKQRKRPENSPKSNIWHIDNAIKENCTWEQTLACLRNSISLDKKYTLQMKGR